MHKLHGNLLVYTSQFFGKPFFYWKHPPADTMDTQNPCQKKTVVIILPTQKMEYYKGNPSKTVHTFFVWSLIPPKKRVAWKKKTWEMSNAPGPFPNNLWFHLLWRSDAKSRRRGDLRGILAFRIGLKNFRDRMGTGMKFLLVKKETLYGCFPK